MFYKQINRIHLKRFDNYFKLKNQKIYRKFSNLSYIHNIGEEPLRALTVGKLLEESVRKYGDNEAIVSIHQNRRVTYKDLLEESDKLAAGFKRIGLNHNDRIGLWAPNLIEWIVTKLACARAGLIFVAINPAYEHFELEYCINKAKIKAIVCGESVKNHNFYDILEIIIPDLSKTEPGQIRSSKVPSLRNIILLSESTRKGAFNYQEIIDLSESSDIAKIQKSQDLVQPDDGFCIQFSSGTTGHPKAALASHFNLVNNSYFCAKRNELGLKQHKICVQVPLFHAFGICATIASAIHHGTTLVLPAPTYNPDKILEAIVKEKCTVIHGTPTMYIDLINKQKERKLNISLDHALTGGAQCSPYLFKEIKTVLNLKKIKSIYGLTETTGVVFQSLLNEEEEKATTTVGHVMEHIEVKVVDSHNRIVPFGTHGELMVRGYGNILGYWDDEKKTRELIGHDKWLRTGDQFVLHENGYGQVVGRLKEMIIRGGENIFPKEIEEFLITHPSIIEAHVIGIPHKRLGEEVCACLRISKRCTLSKQELVDFCSGRISHFKIPSKLVIVDKFPKTMSGKIQKFKLVDLVVSNKVQFTD